MDNNVLLTGLASAVNAGLESYDRESERRRKIAEIEADRKAKKEAKEFDMRRYGFKQTPSGGYERDPNDPYTQGLLMRNLYQDTQASALLGKENIDKLKLEMEARAKGLIKTEEGSFEKSPEQKAKEAAEIEKIKAETEAKRAGAKKTSAATSGLISGSSGEQIPGYIHDQAVKYDKSELKSLRDAVAEKNDFNSKINSIIGKIESADKTQLANPFSEVRKGIMNDIRDAQIAYKGKAFAELGVLAGPDLRLLEEILESPNVLNLSVGGGKQGLKNRYIQALNRVNERINSKLASRGFSPSQKSLTAPPPSDGSKSAAPKFKAGDRRIKNGVTYERQANGSWLPVK